ncbi:MAG: cytochrome c oxidase subunit 4 [Actinomycetota bacterium]|nr:cytochrome c oxidase subunit 4 [Actinomycetota bacterium]
MKVEAWFLVGLAVFFGLVGTVYWFLSYEDAGSVMLAGTALLGLLPGGYYLWWSRRMSPRPEDRSDATIASGASVIGAFPSTSLWPFVAGLGFALVALALIFGLWTALPGFSLVFTAMVGFIRESRRGGAV